MPIAIPDSESVVRNLFARSSPKAWEMLVVIICPEEAMYAANVAGEAQAWILLKKVRVLQSDIGNYVCMNS